MSGAPAGGAFASPAPSRSRAYALGRCVGRLRELRKRPLRNTTIAIALLAVAIACVMVARTWSLAAQPPEWWNVAGELDEAAAAARAEAVERGVSAALYAARPAPGQPWTVELRSQDANAWLRERLPRWLHNRGAAWPEGVSAPRVHLDGGVISVGFAVEREPGGAARVVGVCFRPELDAAGALRVRNVRASLGRVSLPAAAGLDWLPAEWMEEGRGDRLAAIISDGAPLVEEARVELDDGRLVRVVGIEVVSDRLRVTCVDELAPAAEGAGGQ